jgi:glycosyltransferase involved in cell wall biosynthesis
LAANGFDVHVGGPTSSNDLSYDGCTRAVMSDAWDALTYARANNIDILIPHTPPFFSVARYCGPYPIVAVYDHGEPPSELFPDAKERAVVLEEKAFSLALADRLYGNSASVKLESGFPSMVVVPLGNSHLKAWSDESPRSRHLVREIHDWDDKVVVLNVCRFHEMERRYKGVDFFLIVAGIIAFVRREDDPDIVFVQAGKADKADVAYVQSAGVTVKANLSNDELVGLYCAADIYANFSQWEGWNLGIAQALAFGLPVVASDIAAHRLNFNVALAKTPADAARLILDEARRLAGQRSLTERKAQITHWEDRLKPFAQDLTELWLKVNA